MRLVRSEEFWQKCGRASLLGGRRPSADARKRRPDRLPARRASAPRAFVDVHLRTPRVMAELNGLATPLRQDNAVLNRLRSALDEARRVRAGHSRLRTGPRGGRNHEDPVRNRLRQVASVDPRLLGHPTRAREGVYQRADRPRPRLTHRKLPRGVRVPAHRPPQATREEHKPLLDQLADLGDPLPQRQNVHPDHAPLIVQVLVDAPR